MTTVVATNSSQQQQQQHDSYRPLQQVPYEYPSHQYTPAPANMTGQQQSSNTNVVVTNQPAGVATVTVGTPTEKPNPTAFIVTIVLMSFCTFCCGALPLLLCFVPALVLSVVGFNYGYSKSRQFQNRSRLFFSVAIGLNIAAVAVFCVTAVIIAITLGVTLSNSFLGY